MSVLLSHRSESKAEYVNTANKIYIHTINFLSRLSSRYSRLVADSVSGLAAEVLDNAEKANSIYPSDETRKELRKQHLLESRAALMALDVHLSHCYDLMMKKTSIMEFSNVRKNGLAAINLRDDDELIEVKATSRDTDIFLVTKHGMCIRFKETDVRPTGRASMGVIGMNLSDRDEIVGMQLDHQGDSLLIVSENGMGKRTYLEEFTVQKRGGKGLKCYKITEKTGNVVGVKAVNDDHEIMMITTEGIIIQLRMEDISTLGRITSGVKMINLDDNVKVAKIAKVREKISNGEEEFENIDDAMEEIPAEKYE